MQFPTVPDDLSTLSDEDLNALHDELVAAFNETTSGETPLTADDVAALEGLTVTVEKLRTVQGERAEAAAALASTLADLATRVNASVDDEAVEAEAETEGDTEGNEGESEDGDVDAPTETEAPAETETTDTPAETAVEERVAVAADGANKPKAVVAGATIAEMKRNQPARTRPRPQAPDSAVTITAAVDVPGMRGGQTMGGIEEVAVAMAERFRTIGTGNGDSVPVARFTANVPEDRKLGKDLSPSQIEARLKSFDQTPQGITAAGGLCAPVNSYYEQMVIADAARPVKAALANFVADRGGIRYNAPPKLSSLTGGVATITAAQDQAGSPTKATFTVTCPGITEVDINSIYTSLQFGNIGARAYPEYVEAWIKLGLAASAREAERQLLNGISAASTAVTLNGLVGAGRELFARLGQVAAAYRSRNRTKQGFPLRVLLPAWSLDLIQTDFARTFTDETGFISMSDDDIVKLFGVRGLNVSWYLDSKTGGGQIFGAAAGGQNYTDGTTTGTTNWSSATAAFTSADVGKAITGTNIPAGTTIASVTNGTTIVLSQSVTGTTGSGSLSFNVGRSTAAQYPTTVDAFMFPEGSFLHLDAGTLDLGLVRDSTLNSNNQFQMFSETFENVALVGPEAIEVIATLSPDGSYAAAKSISTPINS